LKLGSVLSEYRSGLATLKAIIQGEADPEELADLAQGNVRKKRVELIDVLHGRVTAHHRTMLKFHLGVTRAPKKTLGELDAAVGKTLTPDLRARPAADDHAAYQ
jgi:hypothetical protein